MLVKSCGRLLKLKRGTSPTKKVKERKAMLPPKTIALLRSIPQGAETPILIVQILFLSNSSITTVQFTKVR